MRFSSRCKSNLPKLTTEKMYKPWQHYSLRTGFELTPSGIFNGRDAIRRNMQEAIEMGVHDYTVQRTVSRREGQFILNAGEWKAKVGDQQYQGYYSAILTTEDGQPKILEESVTVAAPGR